MRVRACRRATSSAPSAAHSEAAGAAAAAMLPASAAAGGVLRASAPVAAAREPAAATGAALAALPSGEGAPVNERSRGASCLAALPGLRSAERRTPVTAGAACSSAAVPVARGHVQQVAASAKAELSRPDQSSADSSTMMIVSRYAPTPERTSASAKCTVFSRSSARAPRLSVAGGSVVCVTGL